MRELSNISVVVPCHNYGDYLPSCLQSIIGQTYKPHDILVVDDASDEDIKRIVDQFSRHNVRYMRVEYRNPLLTRAAGFRNTEDDVICFIDADDTIDSFYLERGMKMFRSDRRIGIVYSDVEFVGERNGVSSYPGRSTAADISIQNYIHTGALVRRDALEVADAFNHGGSPRRHEDWSTWRKVLEQGYLAVKQESLYRYTKHREGLSRDRHYGVDGYTYFEGAALSEEKITLFTPLAGRFEYWDRYRSFLENQTWNHRKVQLMFLDTSMDPSFGEKVRRWLLESDYEDVHYLKLPVGRKGLADEKRTDALGTGRREVVDDVRIAVARIYNYLARRVATNYVWVIEDDIIPPLDAAERLLRSFCPNTVSVSGAFRHRYEDAYVVWGENHLCLRGGKGVQLVAGNGFGCVMLRSSILRESVFSRRRDYADYDKAFYADLRSDQLVKIDWDVHCDHLSPTYLNGRQKAPQQILKEENFDEDYYLHCNPDVRDAIKEGAYATAWEHFELFGRREGRAARYVAHEARE